MNQHRQKLRTIRLEETRYPAVRLSMEGFAAEQDDEELERRLMLMFPEADPEEVENFMRSLRRVGKQIAPIARQVAPVAKRALPGIVQGAAQGAAIGGPWGALIGAVGGGTISALTPPSPQTGAAPPAGAMASQPAVTPAAIPSVAAGPQPAPQPARPAQPVSPVSAAPGNSSSQAAAQLLALLGRPEVLQALQALLVGRAGRRQVRVGAQSVPTATIANAISEVALELAEAANQSEDEASLIGMDRFAVSHPWQRSEATNVLLEDMAAEDARQAAHEARWAEEAEYEEDYL
ncbi:MAG: hypothetical protein AAGL10_05705 [Pseudomonadota bacterium]